MNRPADPDEAIGKFEQLAVACVEQHIVEVSIEKHHAARHIFQRDPKLEFLLGQCLHGPLALCNVAPVEVDVGLAHYRHDREGEAAIAEFQLGLLNLGGP